MVVLVFVAQAVKSNVTKTTVIPIFCIFTFFKKHYIHTVATFSPPNAARPTAAG
jgi:hypothetical protein